jgi:DNA repair protein SbcD/Mre11
MTAYRFVHAADVHLDSPLRSLALRDPRLAEFVGNASRQVFSRIVDLCLDEQVSALLLAGDLYDGEQTSMKTARFLAEQLRRLDAADIEVFIIRGNHDALSKITKELVLPENVHLFGGRADAVGVSRERGERPSAIHGLASRGHRPGKACSPNTGRRRRRHQHRTDAHQSGRLAPSRRLRAVEHGRPPRLALPALGHIHKRSTTEGPCAVVMPGIPQGRDVGEHGPKSVTLASVLDDGSITMEGTRQPGAIRTRRRRRLQGGIVVGPNRLAREGPRRGRPQIGIRSPRRATCRFGRDIDGLKHPA